MIIRIAFSYCSVNTKPKQEFTSQQPISCILSIWITCPSLLPLQRPGMPPVSRMTPQGPSMGPPGYGASPVSRPGMPVMDPSRKRPPPNQIQQVQQQNRNQQ